MFLFFFLVVKLCCNLLRINGKGKRGRYVALCGWAAKEDDSIVCFGAKPDKGFLDMKSRRIRKWKGDARGQLAAGQQRGKQQRVDGWRAERQLAAGQQRGEQQRVGVDPRTGAVNTRHRSREARQHGIGSSESESR